MTKAKWPTHYVAAASMSGKPRVLFFAGYDSYAAWEKDVTATDQNAVLSAALEKANQADGELLDSSDQAVFSYKEDLSFNTFSDLSPMRFLELWLVHIKRGHVKDWEEVGKTYRAAYEKAVPDARWAMYEAVYGLPDNTYLLLVSRKSASELDRGPQDDKAVNAALGEEGAKKAGELLAACIESSESQFFYFNPKMSYPPDEWVKADPDFWRPKPAAPAAAKAEKKPSAD